MNGSTSEDSEHGSCSLERRQNRNGYAGQTSITPDLGIAVTQKGDVRFTRCLLAEIPHSAMLKHPSQALAVLPLGSAPQELEVHVNGNRYTAA